MFPANKRWVIAACALGLALSSWIAVRMAFERPSELSTAKTGNPGVGGHAKNAHASFAAAGDAVHLRAFDRIPLPPLDIPLRDAFDELKRRADLGDAKAACQLAAEFDHCDELRGRLRIVEEQLPIFRSALIHASKRQAETLTAGIDRQTGVVLNALEHCDGAPSLSPLQRVHYWRAAALGGHLPSMTHYAIGNGFRLRNTLDTLPALQIYRGEAERIARQAAAAGDPRASFALASAYSPLANDAYRSYLAQTVRPNATEALALYLFLQRAYGGVSSPHLQPIRGFIDRNVAALDGMMPAIQRQRARELAVRRQSGWNAIDTRQSLPEGHILNGGLPDIAPAACQSDRLPLRADAPDTSTAID